MVYWAPTLHRDWESVPDLRLCTDS